MLFLVAPLSPSPVMAADIDLTFRLGDSYTDNIGVTNTARRADHVLGLTSGLTVGVRRPRLEADLVANLTGLHYVNGTFDDQVQRGLFGTVRLNLIEEHLTWVSGESYGPVLEDPLSPDRPDNLTYDSYFTTGPEIVLGSASHLHAQVNLQYARADFQAKDVPSNQQYSGQMSLVLPSNATSNSSLNVRFKRLRQEKVAADSPLYGSDYDFDIREAYLGLKRQAAREDYFIEAGATSVGGSGDSSTGPLLRLGIGHMLTQRTRVAMSLGTQYQDSLGRFRRLQEAGTTDPSDVSNPRQDVINTVGAMSDRFVEMTLSFSGTRTDGYLKADYSRVRVQDSVDALGKQEYTGVTAELQRRIRPRWTLALTSSYNGRTFGEFGRRDDDFFASLSSTWSLLPKLDVLFSVYRTERHSNAIDGDFVANFARLQFVFRPVSRTSRVAGLDNLLRYP
jgi:hypothetical protein